MFAGRTIHLCVTGGIAAYKAAELTRRLIRLGADVRVAMTAGAQEFVGPLTFQSLTRHSVLTRTLDPTEEMDMGHIAFAQDPDLIIVAPATANTIAKAALGIGDGVVSTILLAANVPVVVAPAMNTTMYRSPPVQENIAKLTARGWSVVEPGDGELACGTIGPGRLAEYDDIINAAAQLLRINDRLANRRVVVTAGPTREYIDPVRFLSNPSSGRMGVAVARAALRSGAQVTLVHGPMEVGVPDGVADVAVSSAAEMHRAVMTSATDADAVFMAAAVADWRPEETAGEKQKKDSGTGQLPLVRTTDILADLGQNRVGTRPVLIGWAAETGDPVNAARQKLIRKKVDLIVANDVQQEGCGFGVETNEVVLVSADEERSISLRSKDEIAEDLIHWLAARLDGPT